MSARKDLIESIESALNFNKEGAEKFFDKVVSAIKEEMSPKLRQYQQKAIDDLRESFKEPKLIQGYTSEQWQEIIDGGCLVEVRNSGQEWKLGFYELNNLDLGQPLTFTTKDGCTYNHCRPAQIKGVMRPIFVEPIDNSGIFHFFTKDGGSIGFSNDFDFHPKTENTTKYIEL